MFKSSGDICEPPLPPSLLHELSLDKRHGDGFFSRILLCTYGDSSYNSTDSSLVSGYLSNSYSRLSTIRFLTLCAKSADLQTRGSILRNCVQSALHFCGYSISCLHTVHHGGREGPFQFKLQISISELVISKVAFPKLLFPNLQFKLRRVLF